MAKGRPICYIKVPTPEGYDQPYTLVPVDPLKLCPEILTEIYMVDCEGKGTRQHTLKRVYGLEPIQSK